MIFLRISTPNEVAVERIAALLLKERLVIDVNIKRNIERLVLENDLLSSQRTSLMTAKTKGLLFTQIEKTVRAEFPDENLELYSLPIVNMDWEDAQHLKKDILGD